LHAVRKAKRWTCGNEVASELSRTRGGSSLALSIGDVEVREVKGAAGLVGGDVESEGLPGQPEEAGGRGASRRWPGGGG